MKNAMNKTMKTITAAALLLSSSLFALTSTARAQSDSNVYNERVVVTSRYKPVIGEVHKLNVAPVITDTVTTMSKTFNYEIASRRLTSLYVPSRIKAARIIGEPATRLYNNYLKLGFGNYWSPLAEVYYNSTRSKDYNYGVRATHHSSWGTIGKPGDNTSAGTPGIPSPTHYGQAPFSFTDVALFGKMITKKNLQLSADLGYQNDFSRYYGFNDSTLNSVMGVPRDSISRSDYKIGYNLLTLDLGLKTLNTDVGALGYEANINVTDLIASYNQNEFNINFDGNIHYGFTLAKQYKGVAYLHLVYGGYTSSFAPQSLPLGIDTTGMAGTHSYNYLNLYKANPYIDFLFQGFQIHAGTTIALDAYNIPNGGKVHVYPDATISKTFLHDIVHVALTATGNMDANTWNTIRIVNPYIVPNADVRATSHYDLMAKGRLSLSKKLNFGLTGAYSLIDNDLSFRLDNRYTLGNVFAPVYDSVTRIKVGANLQFINDEMLQVELRGNYYLYHNRSTEQVGDKTMEMPLYYRTPFDASVLVTSNYHDKIIGRIEFQLLGKTPYASTPDAEGNLVYDCLPMRYGLNMEVEYRHNKALSFFLKADNLLFQRYFYWQNYPSYRGLFIAGLTYTIPN